MSADLGDRLADLEASPGQVDAVHAQGGQLAPAQTAVGQGEDHQPVLAGGVGEPGDLLVAEVVACGY